MLDGQILHEAALTVAAGPRCIDDIPGIWDDLVRCGFKLDAAEVAHVVLEAERLRVKLTACRLQIRTVNGRFL